MDVQKRRQVVEGAQAQLHARLLVLPVPQQEFLLLAVNIFNMRPLTEEELGLFIEKLRRYIGAGVKQLVERSDEPHVFRLHNQRVYYVGEALLKKGKFVCTFSFI